jgi:hypothetical protein
MGKCQCCEEDEGSAGGFQSGLPGFSPIGSVLRISAYFTVFISLHYK